VVLTASSFRKAALRRFLVRQNFVYPSRVPGSVPIFQIADSRIVGEKREVPVFVTGEPAAAGKYEAIFEPVADEPKKIQLQQVGDTALFQEMMNPDTSSETARSARSGTFGPGHLGGPITKEQVRFSSYRVTI